MKTLTIFTPAYNRAHTIGRTYESLLRQTCKDFEWLVVDDGSTDNTEALVKGWTEEGLIPIKYIRQENQGMHGAHNTAYRNITTELNTCIDSDDFMPDNGVELIVNFWHEHGSDKYAGIIGLDQTEDGKIIGAAFPDEMKATTLMDYYAKGGSGDKKLVYRTDVIKNYPEYPLFEGERYVGLAYKYMLIDKDYKMLVLNEPLVTVEYQLDGSSYNMYRQYWRNPKGFSFFRKTEMICAPTLKRRFVSCVHYVASSIIAKNKSFLKESPKKALTILALPFGLIWYSRIRSKVRSNSKMEFRN
ncbi:MAG: glycosyltransferase family 2 protein [Bacteroidales bacterium]|nr:glycosyltransferase family 2 protein [Bacteroidales bacterium]